jgi:hypothetical protein
MKKEFEQVIEDEDDIVEIKDSECTDEIDPQYEKYLQNDFQDKIVENIFDDIVEYIKTQAIPICEYLTIEEVECIIENI